MGQFEKQTEKGRQMEKQTNRLTQVKKQLDTYMDTET